MTHTRPGQIRTYGCVPSLRSLGRRVEKRRSGLNRWHSRTSLWFTWNLEPLLNWFLQSFIGKHCALEWRFAFYYALNLMSIRKILSTKVTMYVLLVKRCFFSGSKKFSSLSPSRYQRTSTVIWTQNSLKTSWELTLQMWISPPRPDPPSSLSPTLPQISTWSSR